MKDKIFNRLKQEYAHLGLDDNYLSGLAESLANSGFVTDDNIQSVVSAQKAFLEEMQKSNDKRVQSALDKVTKSKEEQAAKIAELEKKLKEAQEGRQTGTSGDNKEVLDLIKQMKEEREQREKALSDEIAELKKAKEDAAAAAAAEAAKRAAAERSEKINTKAKEKGIPDWIIKRGFGSLPADADDTAIDAYLSEYAQDLKTNFLPGKMSLAQGNPSQPAGKEETDAILAKRFPNAMKENNPN